MNYWEDLTHTRNKLAIKFLWGFYVTAAIMVTIHLGQFMSHHIIGFILCFIATFAVYRQKNVVFTMYLIITIMFVYFLALLELRPHFVNVIFVWLTLILSSIYQQYRVIMLAGAYSAGITVYSFALHGTELINNFQHTDMIYFVLFGAFMTVYFIFYTKFTRDLWVKERENDRHLKNILDSVSVVTLSFDVNTKKMSFSEGITQLTEYSLKDFEDNPNLWKEVIYPKDFKTIAKNYKEFYKGESKVFDIRITTRMKKEKWLQVRVIPVLDSNKKVMQINGVVIDITERRCMEEEIKYMAYHDILTELPNRIQFNDYFIKTLSEAKNEKQQMAILFIDLDKFKTINDTLGHDIGDLLLKETAKRLKAALRETDFVCRVGGDEFIILLNNITNNEVNKLAQRIVDAFKDKFVLRGNTLFVTPSIGISIYPNHGNDIETLIKKADDAMYLAKKKGKNNYQFYNSMLKDA
ncbi:MAG: diguanylate cyclase [Epulopiscium sp.]|nr:diguanylate cyclase [Candidatus Epulonipiscium sp.]